MNFRFNFTGQIFNLDSAVIKHKISLARKEASLHIT